LSPIPLNLYSEYLPMEDAEGFEDFKIEVICTVQYTDDLVLLAKEEKYYRV